MSKHSETERAATPMGSNTLIRFKTASTSSISRPSVPTLERISSEVTVKYPASSTASMIATAMALSVSEKGVSCICQDK